MVESVKAASEIYAPIGGTVTEVNESLADDPAQINADAVGAGWIFKMTPADTAELEDLMDTEAYKEYLEGLE